MCGVSWGNSQHGLDLPCPRPFSPLMVSQSGQGLWASQAWVWELLFLLLCGPWQVASPLCLPWRHYSDCWLTASVPACPMCSQRSASPPALAGEGRWAGKVGFSPVFSSSSPRTPAFRWGGAAPESPEGAGRWLTPPWPLVVVEEGCSRGLAGSSMTLPVTPCEAWWVDGWEQKPLLAVRLSAPRHPRKCCHLSRHP